MGLFVLLLYSCSFFLEDFEEVEEAVVDFSIRPAHLVNVLVLIFVNEDQVLFVGAWRTRAEIFFNIQFAEAMDEELLTAR